MPTRDEIVDRLYACYGSDSGILFGIKERVVRVIVDFTLNQVEDKMEKFNDERDDCGEIEGF